jgi:hypothetical protein
MQLRFWTYVKDVLEAFLVWIYIHKIHEPKKEDIAYNYTFKYVNSDDTPALIPDAIKEVEEIRYFYVNSYTGVATELPCPTQGMPRYDA